jgi:hypothetical protein
MTFAELVLIGRPAEDYTKVDSRTILKEYAAARGCLLYVRVALKHQLSLLDKEFTAKGPSEAVTPLAERVLDIVADHAMLVRRIAAIECEVNRRTSRNAVNQSFGQLKIGVLRNDFESQKEALRRLCRLFASVPWKNDWFHKEDRDGINSLTNLLLAKELDRHQNLDLPSTIERMMDNGFAYLYCAFLRDFMDEMDKTGSRPFERQMEVDELNPDTSKLDLVDDRIHLEKLVIRLRETAMKLDDSVDRKIVLQFADLLGDPHSLNLSDRAIRAPLVRDVADETGFTLQGVRRRLIRGTTLPVLRQVLGVEPDDDEKNSPTCFVLPLRERINT